LSFADEYVDLRRVEGGSVEKKLCIRVKSENSAQAAQTLCQASDGKPTGVEMLGIDIERGNSTWMITVTYEGDGTFTVQSKKGSRIVIRACESHDTFVFEEAES
jgi:hypothetical protein